MKAALRAAEAASRNVKVFAVEKNPYAVITLLTLKEEEWKDKVAWLIKLFSRRCRLARIASVFVVA